MSRLFGNDFDARVDLQRRQRYHQALLDSLRFGARERRSPVRVEQRDPTTRGGRAVGLGISGFFLAAVGVLCFVYTLPAAVLSAIAAFPVAYALMQFTRAMADKWVDSFGGFYRTTWLGIFCYLTITAAVGIGFAIRYAPHTNLGIFSDLSVAISYLRLKPALLVAVFTPGLLACEAVWAHRIGRPLWGVKGFLTAIALSALCVPTALAAICWGAVTILG